MQAFARSWHRETRVWQNRFGAAGVAEHDFALGMLMVLWDLAYGHSTFTAFFNASSMLFCGSPNSLTALEES